MWNSETNFQTGQEGLKLPGQYQPSPHLDVIIFHIIVYTKMESELKLDIQDLAATWDMAAVKVVLGNCVH